MAGFDKRVASYEEAIPFLRQSLPEWRETGNFAKSRIAAGLPACIQRPYSLPG